MLDKIMQLKLQINKTKLTLGQLESQLAQADAEARKLYKEKCLEDDLPNWQSRAWHELSEAQKNYWRQKAYG